MLKNILHILIYRNKFFISIIILICSLIAFFTYSLINKINEKNSLKNMSNLNLNLNIPVEAMELALKHDVNLNQNTEKIESNNSNFIKLLTILASKYYGNWHNFNKTDFENAINELKNEPNEANLLKHYDNYNEFKKFYQSIFTETIGPYKIAKEFDENNKPIFQNKFGLKSYFPIPYDFDANFCDDFEQQNKFLSSKSHLGIDIFAKTKTPIVAVESGIVSDCGKTENFGWQIKIKSFDGFRNYYYSNCYFKKPFSKIIKPNAIVKAGEVIGYVGSTSCCNQKMIKTKNCPHLHFAISLNLNGDENKQIWLNPHNFLQFLQHHKSVVVKTENLEEFKNKYCFFDPTYENYIFKKHNKTN